MKKRSSNQNVKSWNWDSSCRACSRYHSRYFIAKIKELNNDASVNGMLIFRPLPQQLDDVIKYIISPEKDVDCFSPVNVGKMTEGDETGFPPCTPTAVMEILKFYDVDVKGKDVTVVGYLWLLVKSQYLYFYLNEFCNCNLLPYLYKGFC